MTSQALYNRWRSQSFDDVLGQEHITTTLRNQIRAGRIGHAYLFTGLRGTGKTSMARILAKAVNCVGDTDNPPCNVCHMCTTITAGRSLDLMEIDAASNRGIDEIRELRERVGFVPHEARYKVYVIDEVHMLTKEASNALLKTLEEPPPHVIFIMCTTEPHRLLDTILSRCQRFDFRRASVPVLLAKLERICAGEGLEVSTEALEYIARRAAGSFRDAESLLEHIAAHAAGGVDVALVQHLLGAASVEQVTNMIGAMLAGDAASGLRLIDQILDQGADPRQFIGEILDQLRGMLLLSVGNESGAVSLGPVTLETLRGMTREPGFSAGFLLQAIRSFTEAAQGLRNAVRTELPLEVALVETITTAVRPDALQGRAAQVVPAQTETRPADSEAPPAGVTPVEQRIADSIPSPAPAEPAQEAPTQVKSVSVDTQATAEPAPSEPENLPGAGLVVLADEDAPATAQTDDGGAGEAAGPVISLEWVQGKWNHIISRMGAVDRSLQAILRSTYPLRVTGDVVVLGCESAFHRDRLVEGKRALAVEQVMSELLEAPCRIQCVLEKGAAERPSGEPARDEHLFSQMDRRNQREQELRNHPAVKALEQRGGRVTEVDLTEDDT